MKVSVKSILLILAVTALSLSGRAEDQFLYWMISDSPAFGTARIRVANPIPGSDGLLTMVDINDPDNPDYWFTEVPSDESDRTRSSGAPDFGYWAKISTDEAHDFSAYKFIVEVFTDGGALIGRSDMVDYNTLSGYVKPVNPQAGDVAFSAWNIQTVPEPTSGLLTLLGFAALALRRRKILVQNTNPKGKTDR